jgi:hypothetical protein
MISVFERAKTVRALDRAATAIGLHVFGNDSGAHEASYPMGNEDKSAEE